MMLFLIDSVSMLATGCPSFARYADELVDAPDPDPGALVRWADGFLDDLKSGGDPRDSQDAVSRAVIPGLPDSLFAMARIS